MPIVVDLAPDGPGANGYLEDLDNDGLFAAPDDAVFTGATDPSSVWIRAGDATPTRPHRAGVVEFELPAGSSTGDFFISEGTLSLSLVGTVTTGGALDTVFEVQMYGGDGQVTLVDATLPKTLVGTYAPQDTSDDLLLAINPADATSLLNGGATHIGFFIDIPVDALNTTGDHIHLTQLFGSGADPQLTLKFEQVPEPAGSLLMLLGILGVAVCRRLDMFS